MLVRPVLLIVIMLVDNTKNNMCGRKNNRDHSSVFFAQIVGLF